MTGERVGGRAAVYATGVLFVVNMVGYLDRQILTLLVQPIKSSLGLSDGQIGLMQGLAFVMTFTVAGLFIGRLVDSSNRRNLLLVCVAIWSVCAAAGGFAQNGAQLFVARMGVGIGEAALIPTAVSLIADSFEPHRRGRAYGLFTTGIYAGSGLSLILVAFTLPLAGDLSATLAARRYDIAPWRMVMAAMIVPGLLCCALLLTLREPKRERDAVRSAGVGFADWLAGWRLFVPHHLSLAFATFGLYAVGGWMPTVLIRDHAVPPTRVGIVYGALVTMAGVIGAVLGGVASDHRARRAGVRGRLVAMAALIGVGLCGGACLGAPSLVLALGGAALVTGGLGAALVSGIMALSDLSPPRARGRISAIYFVFTGVIGAAGGPAVIGYVNDTVGRLGAVLSAGCAIAAALALALALFTIARVGRRGYPGAEMLSVSGAAS